MRVAGAEAAQDHLAPVGLAVPVAIGEVHELGALDDIEASAGLAGGELEA